MSSQLILILITYDTDHVFTLHRYLLKFYELTRTFCILQKLSSCRWPLNNMDLNCAGPLIHEFFSIYILKNLLDIWDNLKKLADEPYNLSSVQFSRSVMSDSLRSHESQYATPPCPSPLLEFTQTHVHWVGDAIQPSHPLSSSSPPAPNPSQHQGLFQWVNSSHEVTKVRSVTAGTLLPHIT